MGYKIHYVLIAPMIDKCIRLQ